MEHPVEHEAPPAPTPGRRSRRHPYLAGHQWRQDELGDEVVAKSHWRWTAWIVILGWMGTGCVWGVREMVRAPIKVALIEVDPQGTSRVLGFIPERYTLKDAQIAKEVRTFVEVLRRVIDDRVAMGDDWDQRKGLYGRVSDHGRKLLDQYVAEHGDPLKRQELVMVEVVRNLPRGARTRDVSWIERRFSASLQPLDTTRWSGLFTYVERTPRTEAELYANPSGIWLESWSFSRDQ